MGGLGGECVYLPLAGCLNKTKEKKRKDDCLFYPPPRVHPSSVIFRRRTPRHLCLVPSTRQDDTCLQSRNLGGRSKAIRSSGLSLANPKFKASVGYRETLSQVVFQ